MMTTTHAGMGATLGALLAPVAPELAAVAAFGGILGGVFPDLDVFFEHRKTLHYHDYYWAVAVIAGLVAVVWPTPWTVGLTAFFVSAGLHSVTDILGGGLGLRPWLADDERGVYSHREGRWIPPRRWVRYDGAPEELLPTVLFSAVPFLVFDGLLRALVVVGLVISMCYVALRKQLPDLYERYVA